MVINGETIIGISTQIDDADGSLVDVINAVNYKTGVVAKSVMIIASYSLPKTVATLMYKSMVLLVGIAPAGARVYRGGLIPAEENIEIGAADGGAGGATDKLVGDHASGALNLGTNTQNAVNTIDVTDRAGANRAIDILDVALKQVAESRSSLGAVQNRVESTVRNLEVSSENLSASRSRIQDADFAKETAKFSKNQIMQQAGVNILAQANQAPNIDILLG